MKFIAERDRILSALSFVAKFAAADNKIPIIADVLIHAEKGMVSFTSTDMDQAATDAFAAEITDAGSLCLPASLLLKAIKSAPGADVVIDADDRFANVLIGKSKFKLPVLPSSDFPPMTILTREAPCVFSVPGSLLHRVSKSVAFSAEAPNGRYFLIGVSWQIINGRLEFCATDGKKLSLLSIDAPASARSMSPITVPLIEGPVWDDEVTVSASDAFIRFKCGNQVLASKLVEGTYPDYHRLIPANQTSLLFDREELLASLARMALVADAKEHSVLFVGRDGKATLSAVSASGEVSDEVVYHGDDFQIAIVHHVAVPILSSFDCETIEVRFSDHLTGITIHDPKDQGRTTFAMPYRDRRLTEFLPSLYKEAAE